MSPCATPSIAGGYLSGPRIVAATRAWAPPANLDTFTPEAQMLIEREYVTINGSDSARQAVRQALYDGANCIKL